MSDSNSKTGFDNIMVTTMLAIHRSTNTSYLQVGDFVGVQNYVCHQKIMMQWWDCPEVRVHHQHAKPRCPSRYDTSCRGQS